MSCRLPSQTFAFNMQATEEEMEHFREVAEMKEIPFNACPPESRTKMNRVSKPGSEALLQEVMARYQKCWEDADLNEDGFLNEAEWCVYNKLIYEASGEFYGWTPGYDEAARSKSIMLSCLSRLMMTEV